MIADGGFADTRTAAPFVPLGVNLVRKREGSAEDRLFAPYDPAWVEVQLAEIADLGFNTVRFFLDMCMECTTTTDGIRPDLLAAAADLLARIEAHGLVALPTSNDVPDPGYSDRLPCCETFGGYRNSLYLSGEGHTIASQYWTDLVTGLRTAGAPTHHVLGWQLANEQFVLRDVPPISLREGRALTADGVTYDLAVDDDVAAMVVANLRQYITDVGAAVRGADPGAYVTMGFFPADEPAAGRSARDPRWVVPGEIVRRSTLDFVDLHAYPGLGGTWPAIAGAFGIDGAEPAVPLVLGEFGAFTAAYATPADGAAAMAAWQVTSCDHGFDGWLLWLWGEETDDEVIPANAADAVVAQAISPHVRPDPCEIGPYAPANLALGRPATASAEEGAGYDASKAVDGTMGTWWSAAAGPPQWIEIDLEAPATVGRVDIAIGDVAPAGLQTHRVRVRADGEPAPGTLVGEVTVDAPHGAVVSVPFAPVADVRVVRIETVSVDGWVIVHEVEVHPP